MHFGFDDEQLSVRDTVGSLLDKRCGLDAKQGCWADGSAAGLRGLWRELAELGVHGLLAPENSGGSGLDGVTMALVLAETGRVALPLPVMETAAVVVPSVVAAGDPSGVLGDLISGEAVATVVSAGGLAPAAGIADLFLFDAPGGAVLYRRSEVAIDPEASVDRTRDLGRVAPVGDGTELGAEGGICGRLAALGCAAVLIGLGRELVRMTVGYTKERRQFGVPIGSFQAVKHQLADAHLKVEFAAPVVWAAAHQALPPGPGDGGVALAVSMAKAMASDAAAAAARAALQCHGAMGYTDDYHLHFWLKRVWCLAAAHGSAVEHRSRVAEELGI